MMRDSRFNNAGYGDREKPGAKKGGDNAHRQQEWVVAEPEEFQPFDLQALRNSADNKPNRSSSRREA